jgi:hypothetical protein
VSRAGGPLDAGPRIVTDLADDFFRPTTDAPANGRVDGIRDLRGREPKGDRKR